DSAPLKSGACLIGHGIPPVVARWLFNITGAPDRSTDIYGADTVLILPAAAYLWYINAVNHQTSLDAVRTFQTGTDRDGR
ncbi:MAG: hypothetical protein ACLFPD_07785, partial [Desulfosudaceae bacterium]